MSSETHRKIILDLQGQVIALQFMLVAAVAFIGKNSPNGAELLRGIVSSFETFGLLKLSGISGELETDVLHSAIRCIEGTGDALLAETQAVRDSMD